MPNVSNVHLIHASIERGSSPLPSTYPLLFLVVLSSWSSLGPPPRRPSTPPELMPHTPLVVGMRPRSPRRHTPLHSTPLAPIHRPTHTHTHDRRTNLRAQAGAERPSQAAPSPDPQQRAPHLSGTPLSFSTAPEQHPPRPTQSPWRVPPRHAPRVTSTRHTDTIASKASPSVSLIFRKDCSPIAPRSSRRPSSTSSPYGAASPPGGRSCHSARQGRAT